jgi:hypothetical protein
VSGQATGRLEDRRREGGKEARGNEAAMLLVFVFV